MADCSPDECRNPGPKGGRCPACASAQHHAKRRARRASDAQLRERERAYSRRWAAEHPERHHEAARRWRVENPGRVRENNARWHAEHREERAAYHQSRADEVNARAREKRAANPGKSTEYSRRWREAHPVEWALRNRENSRRRQTGRRGTRVLYAAVLERDGMTCHLCRGAIASLADLHLDHVIPLALGGEHREDNVRPAHALCNLRKSDKLI